VSGVTRGRGPSGLPSKLIQLGFVLGLMLFWYGVTVTGAVSPLFLPNPLEVWRMFVGIIVSGESLADVRITFGEVAVAFPIAAGAGTLIGYLVSTNRYAVRVFDPLFAGLFAIPIIVFYPLSVLLFGIGPESKIAHGAMFGFFPVVLNTIQGFSTVNPQLLRFARVTGASRYQVLTRVMFPAALPAMLTGYRIGFVLCFLGIIGGETIASLGGLGHRIIWYAEALQTVKMFAYIVFVILLAVLINAVLSFFESRRERA
jgi:ABC-type nitrate/sulfonate/bicarbonate transport system permease component